MKINKSILVILIIGVLIGIVWWLSKESLTDKLFSAIEKNNIEKAQSVIKSGANVNMVRGYETFTTPLQKAIEEGSHEMVALLLNNGARPARVNDEMKHPLDVSIAIALGETFIASAKPRIPWDTVRQNQKQIIPLLLDLNAQTTYAPEIVIAILTGKVDSIKKRIKP